MRITKKGNKTSKLPLILNPKFQFGGMFPSLPDGFLEAFQGADFGDYDSVVSAGKKIGGVNFGKAMAADDPDMIKNNFMQNFATQQTFQDNPLETAENFQGVGIDQLAEDAAKRRTFLGIGKRRARRKAEEELRGQLDQRNTSIATTNQEAVPGNLTTMGDQFGQATQLLGLLDMFNFAYGGSPGRFQQGGTPEEQAAQYKQWIKEHRPKAMKQLKEDLFSKDQSIMLMGLREALGDMGYDMGDMDIDPKALTPKLKKEILAEYDKYLQSEGEYETGQLIRKTPEGRELRAFQQGGLRQLGYSDNSPYKGMPSISIPGNNITMANTGQPLMAYPNVGAPRLMPPYSGNHIFPGATQVKEVPMKKKGGKLPKKYNYFQEGGEGAIGAQLEVGELFITPNLDIMDTAATEKHKDMKKDVVTDILGPGDYVLSAMEKMKVTRKEAEDASFGMGGTLYEEGEIAKKPIEVLASGMLPEGVDEMNLADYVKATRKKFKLRDIDSPDVFTKKTNAANRESRLPYVAFAAHINEKKRKGPPGQGFASTYENKFNTALSTDARPHKEDGEYAAYANTSPEVPEAQMGGLGIALGGLQGLIGIGAGIGQLGANKNNYRDTMSFLRKDRDAIGNLANSMSQYSGMSTAASLAGIGLQDPNVEGEKYDTTQLDAKIRRTPQNLFDLQASRLTAAAKPYMDQLFRHSGSFSQAVNAYSPVAAANATSMANLGIDQVNRDIQLENSYRDQKQGYADAQMQADVYARNATRSNANQLTGAAASTLSSGIGAQGQIQSDRINALRANNQGQLQAKMDWRTGKNQAWRNIAGSVGQGAAGVYNSMRADQYFKKTPVQNTSMGAPITMGAEFTPGQALTPLLGQEWTPSQPGYQVPPLPQSSIYGRDVYTPYTGPMSAVPPEPYFGPMSTGEAPYRPGMVWDPASGTYHFKKGGRLPKRR